MRSTWPRSRYKVAIACRGLGSSVYKGPRAIPCAAHSRQLDEQFTTDRDLDQVIEDVAGATGSARTSGEHRL
jgi:hypothetical protein